MCEAMRYYKNSAEDVENLMKNCGPTIKFTKKINIIFDLLNKTYEKDAVKDSNLDQFNEVKNIKRQIKIQHCWGYV